MTAPRIPISRPFLGAEERDAVARVLESGWVVQGPSVREFEAKFAAFTGAPFAAAASSCTTALHLVVSALGLRPGDEVIVPAFTWISTANVVEYMGATPVFCDVDLRTFNMDPAALRAAIGPRTVGIIAVHLFGLCADMAAILEIASTNNLWVVEDAACAFGARIDGRHAGTFGQAGCFSFHPRKAITTGEGGMVTTASPDLDSRVRALRDHGASRSDLARHTAANGFLLPAYEVLGYNFRMTDIQGAIGSVQMNRAESILRGRRRQAARYDADLGGLSWLETPVTPSGFEHGYQSYVCLFTPEPPALGRIDAMHERRNRMMARLESQGIATRQGTHAPPFTAYYQRKYGFRPADFPNAYAAEQLSISLPLYHGLEDAQVDEVSSALTAAYA